MTSALLSVSNLHHAHVGFFLIMIRQKDYEPDVEWLLIVIVVGGFREAPG